MCIWLHHPGRAGPNDGREMDWSMEPVDMLLPNMELRLQQPRHAFRRHTTPPALVGGVATDARLAASSSTTLLQLEQVVRTHTHTHTHHASVLRLGPSYFENIAPPGRRCYVEGKAASSVNT